MKSQAISQPERGDSPDTAIFNLKYFVDKHMSTGQKPSSSRMQESRKNMIATAEQLKTDLTDLPSIPVRVAAFRCGAECVGPTVAEFNACVNKCSEQVSKVENVGRMFLDALMDRVELCLSHCSTEPSEDTFNCMTRCYETEQNWILNQKAKWRRRVDDVVTGDRTSGVKEVSIN
jgi:hypothetical protein